MFQLILLFSCPVRAQKFGLWDAEVIFCGFYTRSCMCAHPEEWRWRLSPEHGNIFFSQMRFFQCSSQLLTDFPHSFKSLGFRGPWRTRLCSALWAQGVQLWMFVPLWSLTVLVREVTVLHKLCIYNCDCSHHLYLFRCSTWVTFFQLAFYATRWHAAI